MPEYTGYRGRTLELLKRHGVGVGDPARVSADVIYEGVIMPRYERGDDAHLVLKLKSGYNVGLRTAEITGIEAVRREEVQKKTPPARKTSGLPRILLLSTGGTIASRVDYRTGAVTPALGAEELLEYAPGLGRIADVETEELFSEYSENMEPGHWVRIAERISKCSGYAGVIVAHGTDTMHYTSAYLSFALAGLSFPVALVGSQRSTDRASSDAASNLEGAARLIAQNGTPGIWVVMHHGEGDGTISCHAGTRVRKNHTSRRGAFETVGADPAFVISGDVIQSNFGGRYFGSEKFSPNASLDAGVALVKYHPGYDPGTLDHIIDSGCKAIIFEGTGLGHVGRALYGPIRRAREKGVFMGMTSQCIDGRISMTVYESGRDLLEMGVVPLQMTPETALVKAMWAAGQAKDIGDVMAKEVASEMAP